MLPSAENTAELRGQSRQILTPGRSTRYLPPTSRRQNSDNRSITVKYAVLIPSPRTRRTKRKTKRTEAICRETRLKRPTNDRRRNLQPGHDAGIQQPCILPQLQEPTAKTNAIKASKTKTNAAKCYTKSFKKSRRRGSFTAPSVFSKLLRGKKKGGGLRHTCKRKRYRDISCIRPQACLPVAPSPLPSNGAVDILVFLPTFLFYFP